MANSIKYKDISLAVGDTITIKYIFKEGEKERIQNFKGILLKIRGSDEANRMITVRKIANDGTGVERVIPLVSPFISDIKVDKKSQYTKSKLYFIRGLSEQNIRNRVYKGK